MAGSGFCFGIEYKLLLSPKNKLSMIQHSEEVCQIPKGVGESEREGMKDDQMNLSEWQTCPRGPILSML